MASQFLGSFIFLVWGKKLLNAPHLFFHGIVQDGLEVLALSFDLCLKLLVLLCKNLVLHILFLLESTYIG